MKRALFLLFLLAWHPARADWNYLEVAGAGGVPLNVVTVGEPGNPAILFIHGIGQSHYSFHKQLDSALADRFYLVAFDLRGHGVSGKPWVAEAYTDSSVWAADVAAVIAAAQLDRPLIVAWSYGALVALDYLRLHGDSKVAGLVLTGALGALVPFRMSDTETPESRAVAAEFAHIRELQQSPHLADQIAATRLMIPWLTSSPIPPEESARLESVALMLPSYARRAMMSRQLDNRDLLSALKLPVLLALGSEDNSAMVEDAAALLADRYDNIAFSLFEGAGHSVFYEQADRFNSELQRFAERVNAQPKPAEE